MRILGFIPARGGSKTVPRKNLRPVGGLPLIRYTIEAAKRSQCLTDVVVSTDDQEIAAVAEEQGVRIIMRPAELAGDTAPMIAAVRHVLSVLEPRGKRYEAVVVLQPTAPLRTAEDIDAAVGLLETTGADSVVSVYQVGDHHPARMYRLLEDRLVPYEAEPAGSLRQSLPAVYHRNGAIYACRRHVIDEESSLIGRDLRGYVMPRERSVNIDDEYDVLVADLLLQRLRGTRVEAG